MHLILWFHVQFIENLSAKIGMAIAEKEKAEEVTSPTQESALSPP